MSWHLLRDALSVTRDSFLSLKRLTWYSTGLAHLFKRFEQVVEQLAGVVRPNPVVT